MIYLIFIIILKVYVVINFILWLRELRKDRSDVSRGIYRKVVELEFKLTFGFGIFVFLL